MSNLAINIVNFEVKQHECASQRWPLASHAPWLRVPLQPPVYYYILTSATGFPASTAYASAASRRGVVATQLWRRPLPLFDRHGHMPFSRAAEGDVDVPSNLLLVVSTRGANAIHTSPLREIDVITVFHAT